MSVTAALLGITVISFLLGLGRDLLIAFRFGSSTASDVFFLALLVPMVVESLFGWALRDALIREEQRSSGAARRSGLPLRVLLLTVGLVLLFMLPARTWLGILAPGWSPQVLDAAVAPFVIGVLLIAVILPNFYVSGLFGSRHSLILPGLRSVLLNLPIIAILLVTGASPTLLVAGYAAGYLFHTLLLWWRWSPSQAGVPVEAAASDAIAAEAGIERRSMSNAIFASLAFAAATQSMVVAERWFASFLPEGAVSQLSYAYRVATIPVVLLSLTLIAVLYPIVVSRVLGSDRMLLARTIATGLNALCAILVAASACLLAVPDEIVALLFGRGAFDRQSMEATASAMAGYAFGLAAIGIGLFVSRCLVALGRGRAVIVASIAGAASAIVLDALMVAPLGVRGLAIAMSAGAWIQAAVMLAALRRAAPSGSAPWSLLGWLPIGVLCYLVLSALPIDGPFAVLVAPPIALAVALLAGLSAGFRLLDLRSVM